MIIYEANVNEFINSCKEPLKLITEIQGNLLNKFGIKVRDNEVRSWVNSLPQVAQLLSNNEHDLRKVLCEFNIPTSKQRIDFIILGKDSQGMPSAWIIELKQWSDVTEESWNEFRVGGTYLDSHPSYQAKDYQFRLEHEMGMAGKVNLKSSAYLFNLDNSQSVLFNETYAKALEAARLYYSVDKNDMASDIEKHTIIRDGSEALEYFRDAKWSPTKKFMELVAEDFESIDLYGTQKLVYDKVEHFIKSWDKENKMMFLISGNPGSGKTIVAFKIALLLIKELGINVQLMIPGQEVRSAFKYEIRDKKLSTIISGSNVGKYNDAAIIDEAHKAIGRDTGIVNYKRNLKRLKFAIVLIDDDQVINKKGVTKAEVEKIAKEEGFSTHSYNIEEAFRNSGERSLIDWIDHVFYNRETVNGDFVYSHEKYVNRNQAYKVYSYLDDKSFVDSYYENRKNGSSTRMTSLWHKQFYIGPADESGMVPKTVNIGNYKFAWNPNEEWRKKQSPRDMQTYNKFINIYSQDRKQFLIGNPHEDWIAYFNHIQGYEFENIFVYIPNVFTYENNKIVFHRERLAKEVMVSQTWANKSKSKELNGRDAYELNKGYFLNRIKVMLTRGTKSTHIFAEDPALNKYIYEKIDND